MARKNPKPARAARRKSAPRAPVGDGPARSAPGAAPAPGPLDLGEARGRIDAVDEKIQALINERARLAQQVGISKTSGARTVDFYRPEREAQVLRQAQARNTGPLRDAEILRLFREIMSACLAQQEPLKVAFLGPEGTFTQTAVLNHFGHSVRALPLASIDERSEEHTSELQSPDTTSYAVFCLKKKKNQHIKEPHMHQPHPIKQAALPQNI